MNTHALLEIVNLPDLIAYLAGMDAVRGLNRERGGVICDPRPGCAERNASFSVYRHGQVWRWKRHGSDEAHGSAYDLLLAFDYSRAAAWEELARLAGAPLDRWMARRLAKPPLAYDLLADAQAKVAQYAPLSPVEMARVQGLVASLREGDGPSCELRMRGLLDWPGLTAGKLKRHFTSPDGRMLAHSGALAFLVRGPDGLPWGLKVRNAGTGNGMMGQHRYVYRIGGHGAPAWCSPNYGTGEALLIVEGELNGAAAARALGVIGERLDVQGLAGAGGTPFLNGMTGRTVYVYADPDAPGRESVQRVGRLAHAAGAWAVRVLPPLTTGDFSEVAGERGLDGLGMMLLGLLRGASSHHFALPHDESAGKKGGSAITIHHTPGQGVMVRPSVEQIALGKYRKKLRNRLGGKR